MSTLFSLLGMIVTVAVVLGLAYWFTRRMGTNGGFAGFRMGGGDAHLRVLAQTAVGREERLLVVQAGERCFLLGVTPAGISKLAEFTSEEAALWQREDGGQPPAPPSFRDALQSCLGKKK